MKKLILVLNDLAGTGKTTSAQVLHEYLLRRGVEHIQVSTDATSDLHLPEVEVLDIANCLEPHDIISLIDRGGVAIVDVHSEDGAAILGDFFVENEIAALLGELDASLTLVIPVNDDLESFEGIEGLTRAFADDAEYVVVRSAIPAEYGDAFEGSEGAHALGQLGAIFVEMPEMDCDLLGELERLGHSVAEALFDRQQLPRYVRNDLHAWEIDFSEALGEADEFLLPGGHKESVSVMISPYATGEFGLAS
ncbi:hypothetical protein BH23VER1_BH23VER1_21420 [soil metagenome]